MIRKNIFKLMALALLMPATMLLTACGNEDEVVNPEKTQNGNTQTENTAQKGYPLQVTVNATRQGDGTKATYNESTKMLEFSTGDKLYVGGKDESVGGAGWFAGTLDMVSEGTFSGTIYTENPYTGTADALLAGANTVAACLLPNYFATYEYLSISGSGYSTDVILNPNRTFTTSKTTALEQFSYERSLVYSSGFALTPNNAILNFTITGLTPSTKVNVALTGPNDLNITGSVTTDGSGTATFAIGIESSTDFQDLSLTVGGNAIPLASGSKTLAAGKIYNITRNAIPGALVGQFSVGAKKKVYFSKGNLRYASSTWSFFDQQYDCYDDYSSDGRDKFGWSTLSTTYGMSTSTNVGDYSGSFVDWGTVPGIGEGWYTLSHEEWVYLFNTRSGAASKYGYATVNDVHGIIILPDAFVDPNKNKGSNAFVGSTTAWNANVYTTANWAYMEAAGAVFLPAAGYRNGASVSSVGSIGDYWSSTAADGVIKAYGVDFASELVADYSDNRSYGYSVRLVQVAIQTE